MKNWASNYQFNAKRLFRPTSIFEIQKLVASSQKIRAIGSRHSFNGNGDTTGDIVDLSAIDPAFKLDIARGLIWVGAGCTYGVLADYLHRHGWALHNLASLPHISVAGAVQTGTHGSGDRLGTLSSSVAGLELITWDGSIRSLARGDEEFDCLVVGLGAFGIVSRIALDVIPTFSVRQDAYCDLAWDTVLSNFGALTSAAYSVSILTKCSGNAADRVWLKSRTTEQEDKQADISRLGLSPGSPLGSFPDEETTSSLNPFGVTGPWFERLPHTPATVEPTPSEQFQSEYLIGRDRFSEALAIVRSMGSEIDPLLHAMEIRTMAADSLWLSPAFGRPTVGFHFTWKRLPKPVHDITTILEERMVELGARPHWAKVLHSDASTLAKLYPRMADFQAKVGEWDPMGKFTNRFLMRHVLA